MPANDVLNEMLDYRLILTKIKSKGVQMRRKVFASKKVPKTSSGTYVLRHFVATPIVDAPNLVFWEAPLVHHSIERNSRLGG